jgi:glucose/arabinose dehydrogenase
MTVLKRTTVSGAIASLCGAAMAQSPPPALTGAAAYGDWRVDAPGVSRKITADDLPAPYASKPTATGSIVSPRPENAVPKTPAGFRAQLVASGLSGPRVLRLAPNGDVFLAESGGGRVRVLRFAPGAARPVENSVFASGLEEPFGIAFYPPGPQPRYVYVGTPAKVVRFPYQSGDLRAAGPPEDVADLPNGGGHSTRDLAFSPDGAALYVSVGSRSNAADGTRPLFRTDAEALERDQGLGAIGGAERGRADVLAFDPEGGHKRHFANGLRNCTGLTIRPGGGDVWCAVNERDMLGDDLPPDFATRVQEGGFYGWPWYYIGAHEDPRHAGERPELAQKVITPDVLIQPHSAPLGIVFYEGAQFPSDYRGDAFVALRGSWNRSKLTGYKIVRLRFKDGAPTGAYEDFVTGLVIDDAHVWARPVGVAVAADGALLFSEDGNGTIWRVAYEGR